MKINKKLFGAFLLLFLGFTTAYAQENEPKVKTVEFEVKGVCEMCKERIETAALVKGIRFAEWNQEKQILKVIFKTKLANEIDVHKAVAEAGHDTPKIKAKDETYKTLPACCAYRNGVESH